jgi:Tol biopolymer transport system component
MLAILSVVSAAAACPVVEVAGVPSENHVLFHGVSPDGRTIAVGWDRGSGPATQRGAYLLDLKTRKRTDLPHLNNAPSFSRDGRVLVSANYPGDRALRTEVVELDRRTGMARTYASGPSAEWLASYSRDGRSILFNSTRTGGSDLYEADRATGALLRLTSDPRYEAHASYMDGGRRIIFHRQTEGDNYDVVIRDLKSGVEQTVGATATEEAYPAMSPDGRWIAFSQVPAAGAQPNLYVMRRDGGGRVRLTEGAAKDAYATWSPDGRAIYFVRFEEGGSKIFRMKMKGGRCAG